jgi:hypothetical protein
MLRVLSILFFTLFGTIATAQLSPESKIFLVTVSPGEELYSGFGHSAVWVLDPESGTDMVFNYGTFDFNTPNFYLKFSAGKLDYMLSAGTIRYMVEGARYENRSVYSQELDLKLEDKNALFAFLVDNLKPENRFYRYDFLFDNCSTRIRDVLESILGEKLQWNKETQGMTFRAMLESYLDYKRWVSLGFDLGLGVTVDREVTGWEEMFLPLELMDGFDKATLNGKPLVKETMTIYQAPDIAQSVGIFTPKNIFWTIVIFGFVLGIRQRKTNIHLAWFDRSLFFLTGIVGLVVFMLWFFTEHHVTVNNWNIIWANPLHLVLPFFLFTKKTSKWQEYYYLIFGAIWLLMVGFYYTLPQVLPAPMFPVVLYMGLRSIMVFYQSKKIHVR